MYSSCGQGQDWLLVCRSGALCQAQRDVEESTNELDACGSEFRPQASPQTRRPSDRVYVCPGAVLARWEV